MAQRTRPVRRGRQTSCWVEIRECEESQCRELFVAHRQRDRRFCSMSCSSRHRDGQLTVEQRAARDQQWARDRLPQGERCCGICHEQYVPASARQQWCSRCIPDRQARGRYLRTGMTHPQWVAALARFNGMCWICRSEPATDADHCHASGRPRGALCFRCNVQLGLYEDHAWGLLAGAYLKEFV